MDNRHSFREVKNYNAIARNHDFETKLLHAVKKGAKEEVIRMSFLDKHDSNIPMHLSGDPLRINKNITISFNTLLSRAAIEGGVPPVYARSLCGKFSMQTESAKNIHDISQIRKEMLITYCDSVKNMNTKNYSPITSKAVEYILTNITGSLKLNNIAEHLHVTPPHLSRIFKKETGLTITDFIHTKKIEEAKYFIKQRKMSIIEVSQLVGYDNPTYFGKVFKRITSMTPSEFAKKD